MESNLEVIISLTLSNDYFLSVASILSASSRVISLYFEDNCVVDSQSESVPKRERSS